MADRSVVDSQRSDRGAFGHNEQEIHLLALRAGKPYLATERGT